MLHQGQTFRVDALTGDRVTLSGDRGYRVGPPARSHESHEPLRVGDTLHVVKDSAPNGDVLVTIGRCGCSMMLLAD